jgi:3-oxoacyl-[acyl-carrier-protein] synthase III
MSTVTSRPNGSNRACLRAAGLSQARTLDTLRRYASSGSASVPVNLAHAGEAGQLHAGDVVMLFSFGAGLAASASVVRW